jgi:hypothetical protein
VDHRIPADRVASIHDVSLPSAAEGAESDWRAIGHPGHGAYASSPLNKGRLPEHGVPSK